jgi:hypothetical protein
MTKMIEAVEAMKTMEGKGFEKIHHIPGTTYKDNSTIVITPTRGMIHYKVVQAWQSLIAPMNQKRSWLYATGHEVGKAYDSMVEFALSNPDLSKYKYILTLEDDNIPPMDAHIRLLESIEAGPFDAVGGIYFTKGDYNMPMAYGDPVEFKNTGILDFKPRNVVEAIKNGYIMEVNGIAMGCSLYRIELFKEFPKPWFVTVADVVEGKGAHGFTQDLFFCERAVRAGKRFAVDFRVKVGHLDVNSEVVY